MFSILHSEVFLFTVLTPFGEKKKTFGDDAYLKCFAHKTSSSRVGFQNNRTMNSKARIVR